MKRAIGPLLFAIVAGTLGTGAPAAADDLAAQRAAAYQLAGAQQATGLLDYDMDFLAGSGGGSGTSNREKAAFIARQAAAAYGLAKYFEQTKDERVGAAVAKLIAALGDLSLPIGKSASQRLVEFHGRAIVAGPSPDAPEHTQRSRTALHRRWQWCTRRLRAGLCDDLGGNDGDGPDGRAALFPRLRRWPLRPRARAVAQRPGRLARAGQWIPGIPQRHRGGCLRQWRKPGSCTPSSSTRFPPDP